MTKPFEFLPHTADVRVKVFGGTYQELFKNAMLVMAEMLKNQKSQKLLKEKISVKSQDINSLLVDFLSEVLYRSQVHRAVFQEVKFLKFKDTELEAEIYGFKVDEFDEDIKAVTYYELEIKESTAGGFETIIVFDI